MSIVSQAVTVMSAVIQSLPASYAYQHLAGGINTRVFMYLFYVHNHSTHTRRQCFERNNAYIRKHCIVCHCIQSSVCSRSMSQLFSP